MIRDRIIVIGGMDPSGGAGLLRDTWTIERRAPQLEIHAVCTAITRQGEGGPAKSSSTPVDTLARELERVAALERVRAVKLGMIPSDHVARVDDFLAQLRGRPSEVRPRIVCDPVGTASAGGRLGASPSELLRLATRVDLLTPNLAELAELEADGRLPSTAAILHKGQSVEDRPDRICDRLEFPDGSSQAFERPRLSGPDPRGTGCALASAIAAELARGRSLITAVAAAVAWLDGVRRRAVQVRDEWHLPGC